MSETYIHLQGAYSLWETLTVTRSFYPNVTRDPQGRAQNGTAMAGDSPSAGNSMDTMYQLHSAFFGDPSSSSQV